MKRRVVELLLISLMAGSLLAGCGKQEETKTTEAAKAGTSITLGKEISVEGTGATVSGETITINQGGSYSFSGTSEQVAVVVDCEEEVTLVLDGVTMTNPNGAVIYGENAKSITVETAKGTENVLTDGSTYASEEQKAVISSNDDLIFTGEGSLQITGNYKHCIAGDDDITFQGGDYQLTAAIKDGVHGNNTVTVEDGTFQITAVSDCMESEGDLIVSGGKITGESQEEGLEGKNDVLLQGGTISLTTVDDGINGGNAITVEDGTLEIMASQGDAMDANGSLVIKGGSILAYGGSAPEGALDCDNAQIQILGGTVIAVGDANSAISTESEQVTVLLGQYNKGDEIAIATEDGKEILSFTLQEARSNMIVSSKEIEQGSTYQVLVNGTQERSFTADSTQVAAGGQSQSMGGMQRQGDMQMPEQQGNMEFPQRGQGEMGQPSGQPPMGQKQQIVQ